MNKNMFAIRFKEKRRELGYTQDDIARILNVQRPTISCYERGVFLPTTKALPEIAHALGVSVEYLTGNSEFETNTEVIKNWYSKRNGEYIVHDFEQLISDLIEQVQLDEKLSFKNEIISDNKKEMIYNQLKNIVSLLSL